MLGFILRRLPFWVREPVFIAIGSVLGVRILYLAVRDHRLVLAGLGVLFLVFAAVHVVMVIRALRARRERRRTGAAGEGNTTVTAAVAHPHPHPHPHPQPQAHPSQPQPQPVPGTGPQPGPYVPEKEPNAWGQAAAAIALFGVLGAALWLAPRVMPSGESTPEAAACPAAEHRELPKAYRRTPQPVTGEALCEALNSPDLAQLLGTPGEIATAATSSDNTAPLTGGKVANPEAQITFDTYTVNVSATYNELTTDQYVKLMKYGDERDIRTLTVLDRPAVLSSDHTMRIEIDLGSGGGSGGPVGQGPLARTLSVALDRKDRGGSCDITVWSQSGELPDDSALLGIAEKILPRIPERSA
ncbi:DUF6215 domain-containing protein [Streptomyces sp. NPDC093272]|uniref:DUF6215 domain-containing protein n=1 Tax=Streptomyces sp. NPDC093272 TaxID=3154981 RepID=UPI003424E96E